MAKTNKEVNSPIVNSIQDNYNISKYFDNEYVDFSKYVISTRACPSLIDGFKVGARKIMHAAFNGAVKNGKPVKLLNLSGDTMKMSLYAHGDSSLNSTIISMAQDFNDNLNPLEIEGQFGSLRSQEASSPRYLYVKLSKYANLIYKTDIDLVEYVFDEGEYLEPINYLPIIPTVLTNRNLGMAPGYRFSTMSYNPIDIIDNCIANLENKKQKVMSPYIRGIKNENWEYVTTEDNVSYWVNKGRWRYEINKDKMYVEDLPYDIEFSDFEKLLNKFCENGFIKDWMNYSEDNNIKYEIVFDKGRLKSEIGRNDTALPNKFKLIKRVPDDQLYVIDEHGKVKYFNTNIDLLNYFTNYRLGIYDKRKSLLLEILNNKLSANTELAKFIDLIIKEKLKINNRPKNEIKADMKSFGISENLISTPISKLTKEEYEALLKENEEIKNNIEYITNTTTKDMYLDDLKKLKKEIKKDFE